MTFYDMHPFPKNDILRLVRTIATHQNKKSEIIHFRIILWMIRILIVTRINYLDWLAIY